MADPKKIDFNDPASRIADAAAAAVAKNNTDGKPYVGETGVTVQKQRLHELVVANPAAAAKALQLFSDPEKAKYFVGNKDAITVKPEEAMALIRADMEGLVSQGTKTQSAPAPIRAVPAEPAANAALPARK